MAGKLILLFNNEKVGEYQLDKESVIIGRRPTCDIQVDNLAVSGAHARILTILNDSFVEDLESTNGTFVNGNRIRKHALQAGDLITIGKHQLRFEPDPTVDGGEEKVVPSTFASEDANASVSGLRPAKLRLLTDDGPGKELKLTKALTTVGKPGVQVAAVSRRQQGDFIVHVDGGEDNAAVPVVNGAPIGYKSRLLKHQDVIEIAGVRMEYLQE